MGICASSHYIKGGSLSWPPSAKIIHLDGRLQEFRQTIKASHVLSQNPKCFLCNSELMYIDSPVPHVPQDEELQLGQIYFLMPLSKSQASLSLQDLCLLAVKASAALSRLEMECSSRKFLHFSDKNGVQLANGSSRGHCKVPTGFGITRMNSPAKPGNQIL